MSTTTAASLIPMLNTRKEQVESVMQTRGIAGQLSQVVLVLDRSTSMDRLYHNGTVQTIVERVLPLGMAMDDNQTIEFYGFHDNAFKCPDVTLTNIKNYVDSQIPKNEWGGTMYGRALERVASDTGINLRGVMPVAAGSFLEKLQGKGKYKTGLAESEQKVFQYPKLVIFITDGETFDKDQTENIMRELSQYGVFVQFIGVGSASLDFLAKLDTLKGTLVDNSNFFRVNDISELTDGQLYERIIGEYSTWIPKARSLNLIR